MKQLFTYLRGAVLSFELTPEDLAAREWYEMVRGIVIHLVNPVEGVVATLHQPERDDPSELGERAPDGRRWAELMAAPQWEPMIRTDLRG